MTVWDFLGKLASSLSPIVTLVSVVAVVVVFIIGFSKHGMDFIKHGFKRTSLDESLERRLNNLGESLERRITELGASQAIQNESLERRITELGASQITQNESLERRLGTRIDGLHTELDMIKVNHFGHLKSYLEILDGILLDKNIISNKEKAMLDSQLRGM
ncbi:MAG: hypothetical protein LBU17_05100 [Treponema sp.]|jgi:hypothetical protein|nr:hypothetical protein [Treponema sp.]